MRAAAWIVAALAGIGAVRAVDALAEAWRARVGDDEPEAPVAVWAAHSGFREGARERSRLVLFAARDEATEYAARRGMYVERLALGERVIPVLKRAAVAPVIPWPGDRVDRPP